MAIVSQREASKLAKKMENAQRRLAKIREDNNAQIQSATRTAVTMGGAFGMAWWQGRYPDRSEILGLQASLVVGGGLTVAALMGWAGDESTTTIVESLGTGALAAYAVSQGYQLGQEQAQAA